MDKNSIVEDIKENLTILIGTFCILLLVLMALYFRRRIIATVLGCVSVVIIILEKRAKTFDRIASIASITVTSCGFMLIP